MNITGGLAATAACSGASLVATSGGATITGGLTVATGGAAITGNSSVAGTLNVSGALRGAGITTLLAPYALASQVPVSVYAVSPLIGTLAISAQLVEHLGITFDPTQPLTCTNITAT